MTKLFAWVVNAPDEDTANRLFSDLDGIVGSYQDGSAPNGIVGVEILGGAISELSQPLEVAGRGMSPPIIEPAL